MWKIFKLFCKKKEPVQKEQPVIACQNCGNCLILTRFTIPRLLEQNYVCLASPMKKNRDFLTGEIIAREHELCLVVNLFCDCKLFVPGKPKIE